MSRPWTWIAPDAIPADLVDAGVRALAEELELAPEFAPEVLADAGEQARTPDLGAHEDLTDIPFVTIDPPGARDLDQAMRLQRRGSGYSVHYAIADVAAFVRPGSPVDREAHHRGQTMYAPGRRFPLHPPPLSEQAASLLAGVDRPAYVWSIELDAAGEITSVDLRRAVVRSQAQLTYEQVQTAHDAGNPVPSVALLGEIGPLLELAGQARGASSLAIPDQELVRDEEGNYVLRYRPLLPAEDWNAQISLLTGMVAAGLMLGAQVGILRTLPPPQDRTLSRFRRQAAALGTPWPADRQYGDFLRSLDPARPKQLALLHFSATLFRGAGYTPFDGDVPEQAEQAAVGAPYAHTTAPLRRLVDRYVLAICHSICTGERVPGWVRTELFELPTIMAESDRTARAVDRACVDMAEAMLLADRMQQTFDAVVVDVPEDDEDDEDLSVQLADPAVLAPCSGDGELGQQLRVRVAHADPVARRVRLRVVGQDSGPTG
ncbi:MAG: ribonuclease II [Micrococcales bacterium]|nr:MAG: ribonuclease II [Micrococcales bacterium]